MLFRTRLAIILISIGIIGLEITLMRVLALRFWSHLAAMVISVALLGFGCSGTILTLFQDRLRRRLRLWLMVLAMTGALAILLCSWGVQQVPLDVHYLAWDLTSEAGHILIIELLMMLPFLVIGAFVGLVLMGEPEQIHGHYGANLVGSGVGAFLSVALMYRLSTVSLLILWALLCWGAGLVLMRFSHSVERWWSLAATGALIALIWSLPADIELSPYKRLALERSKTDTRVIAQTHGPLGRIDIVRGQSIHDAPPGMSLHNPHPLPERNLLTIDGDSAHILYAAHHIEDYRFLNATTTALPFALSSQEKVLFIGTSGGAALALAKLHNSREISALETNKQMVELIRSGSGNPGEHFFDHEDIDIFFELPRTYLRGSDKRFDLILVPLLDGGGSGGAGLHAARENHLYTLETFRTCLDHLEESGIFGISVFAHNPPRDGLRLFNLAAEALAGKGYDPTKRLVLIRSWETVTLLATKAPLTPAQKATIRNFGRQYGFDLAYLPDLEDDETNLHHRLEKPLYAQGARQLLGLNRQEFVESYLFRLTIPTEDRPYFDHFMRWNHLGALKKQFKGRMPAFIEVGSLLPALAFAQVTILAAILVFLPLFFKSPGKTPSRGKGLVLVYFFLLGLGFMVLEMSFLQKMVLYLGHPIYSAAVVIASFLLFAGLGSQISRRCSPHYVQAAFRAGLLIAIMIGIYILFLDHWLDLTQGASLFLRFCIVGATIAPLSFAMGFMFPLGLGYLAGESPFLVPWAWAVNAFASVLATAGTPLAAMMAGFSLLMFAALFCYLAAAFLLPRAAANLNHSPSR